MKVTWPRLFLLIVIALVVVHVAVITITHQNGTVQYDENREKLKQLNQTLHRLRNELKAIHETQHILTKPIASIASNLRLHENVQMKNSLVAKHVSKERPGKPGPPTNDAQQNNFIVESLPSQVSKKTALLFTMDSISSYEINSKQGGAAGVMI